MLASLGFIPPFFVCFLYAWYLRLAGKWAYQIVLSWRLCLLYSAVVLSITFVTLFIPMEGWQYAIFCCVGYLVVGSLFFGIFVVTESKKALGFLGGMKITAIGMGLFIPTAAILFFLLNLVQQNSGS